MQGTKCENAFSYTNANCYLFSINCNKSSKATFDLIYKWVLQTVYFFFQRLRQEQWRVWWTPGVWREWIRILPVLTQWQNWTGRWRHWDDFCPRQSTVRHTHTHTYIHGCMCTYVQETTTKSPTKFMLGPTVTNAYPSSSLANNVYVCMFMCILFAILPGCLLACRLVAAGWWLMALPAAERSAASDI